jgi:hypothetical protein
VFGEDYIDFTFVTVIQFYPNFVLRNINSWNLFGGNYLNDVSKAYYGLVSNKINVSVKYI